jgi:GntR family transcriptional repressor for pyruvate dehydrogenase complex
VLDGENQVLKTVSDLVSFIRQRGYEPGERLPSERDLTNRFSVGRGVIREALTFLEASRYIERRRNSGIYLSGVADQVSLEALVLYSKLNIPLDRRTIVECMEVRKILEVQAMQLACERRTDADLAALKLILANSQAAIDAGLSIADLDLEFHMAIFRAGQNDVFVRVVTPFYLMSRQRRDAFFADPRHGVDSQSHHAIMVQAIEDRDVAKAIALMNSHIGRVEDHYLTTLPGDDRSIQ